MTKILYVPAGELVEFVSSIEWDEAHSDNCTDCVVRYEDSYVHSRGIPITQWIYNTVTDTTYREGNLYNSFFQHPLVLEDFEIIYD
jgi:hypothetical protein